MTDHSMMKLGRVEAILDPRTPSVSSILRQDISIAPKKQSWSRGRKDWLMLANDQVGNCTIAGLLHQLMLCNPDFVPTDAMAIALYSAITGYNPHAWNYFKHCNPTDNGAALQDVLAYWFKNPIEGVKLLGQAFVNPRNHMEVALASHNFPGLYSGVALPLYAQNQDVWDVSDVQLTNDAKAKPGSWGGHCIALFDYDYTGETMTFVTWGGLKIATFRWVDAYCDEMFAFLPDSFIKDSESPMNIDVAILQDYMGKLQHWNGVV